jgi:hypothetical protein
LLLSLGTAAQTQPKAAPPAKPAASPAKPPTGSAAHAPNCNDKCVVTVIVPASCGSGIKVAPDPIVVGRDKTPSIYWNIVPADPKGWKFDPKKGIEIQGIGEPSADGRFPKGPPVRDRTDHMFKVDHANKGAAAFKYDVNLIGPDGQPCQLDPTILDQ